MAGEEGRTDAGAAGGKPRLPADFPTREKLPERERRVWVMTPGGGETGGRAKDAPGGLWCETCTIQVTLKVVTPILGGGPRTRELDEVDVIRVPTVRGHLRFWWRALYGHEYKTARELYEAESGLWGRAGDENGGRSAVSIHIRVDYKGIADNNDVKLYGRDQTPGAYALWPAKEQKKTGEGCGTGFPPAPRRQDVRFHLTLIGPETKEVELKNTLRAWILFGGYGSRTRRGLGSLTATGNDTGKWLPRAATREALRTLFEDDVFGPPKNKTFETPSLRNASLMAGDAVAQPETVWRKALEWLRGFRQGTNTGAREPDPDGGSRPSRSNWPEADKVRHLASLKEKKQCSHQPRYNDSPVWPRAEFGLPIIGQFQREGRNGETLIEPENFEIRWSSVHGEHDRLASPLIVKALPLTNQRFAPCALWFNREAPQYAEVGLVRAKPKDPSKKEVDPDSAAPLGNLVAKDESAKALALLQLIAGKSTLRQAFLDWLKNSSQAKQVAP